MSQNTERGSRSERGSALWGTGSRGGDRSSVLWGKGGRGILVSCIAAFALAAPMAALADSGKGSKGDSGAIASSFIAPSLLNATGKVDVIIQSSGGTSDAVSKTKGLGVFQKDMKQLSLVNGVEAVVPASQLKKLQGVSGIVVTPNANVKLSGRRHDSAVAVRIGQRTDVARRHDHVCRQDACDRHRRLGDPEPCRLRRSRHRERQSLDDRGQHFAQRRARSRHLRGRHRGGRFSGSDRCGSCSTARLGEGHERSGSGQDVRRHHGRCSGSWTTSRSTTSASPTSPCIRATARTSIVTRSIRQSRSSGSAVWSWLLQPATTDRRAGPRACSTLRATTRS